MPTPEGVFKILMVEDMKRYHELFAREITDALAAKVEFAASGEEALAVLGKENEYDLVLLDINLPNMGGKEVLAEIRQNPRFDTLPVMILTGNTDQKLQTELFALGANDFVEKGCAPEVFVARLKAQVRQKHVLDRLTQLALDRDIFAAGVLHDIRNIETAILANCDIIDMQLKKDPVKNLPQVFTDLGSLREQIARIGQYADGVIAKVRGNFNEIKVRAQNFGDIIKWVELALNDKRAVPITWDAVTPLKAVMADEQLLRLIILNIFQNSRKYTQRGEPARLHISQGLKQIGTDTKPRLVTKFRDYGIGVKPNDLRKIFQPFYRGVSNHDFTGSGLGLALASRVCAKMQGQMWAELPEGDKKGGVTICLELPPG